MKLRRMIFLDRDGVINHNPVYLDYIKKPSEFRFLPGVKKAIRMLTDAGLDIAIVSNQSGVSKGLFTKKDLKDIDKKMFKGVILSGGKIKAAYYCIHPTEINCGCKKPKTGMFKKATRNIRLDFKNSYCIGDTERDIIAGSSFGVKTILVLTGYAKRKDIKKWKIKPDFIAKDLLSAVCNIILKYEG